MIHAFDQLPEWAKVALALAFVVLLVMWALLPFIVSHKLQLLIRESKRQTALLARLVRKDHEAEMPSDPFADLLVERPRSYAWPVLFFLLLAGLAVMVVGRMRGAW